MNWVTTLWAMITGASLSIAAVYMVAWLRTRESPAYLMFALLAAAGKDLQLLTLTIAVENLSGGMGTAAFVAYLSSLCNVAYTATQYALLSSFMAFGRTLLSSSGGWLADQMDWVSFFVLTTFAALPGLLLLIRLARTYGESASEKD